MQGRLSAPVNGQIQAFPSNDWPDEFARAAAAELNAIEWIFDGPVNPVLDDAGVERIRALERETGVGVRSICADYFMDATLHRGTKHEIGARVDVLRSLIARAGELGVGHIVLPFVDQSAIKTTDDRSRLEDVMASVTPFADEQHVELHLETSLGPNEFASLLDRMPSTVMANYDSGNSASLGYDVQEEFAAYGERVGSVHIKDRLRGGGTVPLGSGNAEFVPLFEALEQAGYRGLFTLQVARGDTGGEVDLARANRAFLMRHLKHTAERA